MTIFTFGFGFLIYSEAFSNHKNKPSRKFVFLSSICYSMVDNRYPKYLYGFSLFTFDTRRILTSPPMLYSVFF